MASAPIETIRILELPFAVGNVEPLTDAALDLRGMVTLPSAPCLVLALKDPTYGQQLASSQLTLPDSGAMVLMWRLVHPRTPLRRVSGLAFLKAMLSDPRLRQPGALFLVDPSSEASERNREFLRSVGIDLAPDCQYVAPLYQPGKVEDPTLLELLRDGKPRYVLVNLGGGIQERLGSWLQTQWHPEPAKPELPAIFCTGAAIAFLTGEQSGIPSWADRFYLGWAFRCLGQPTLYVPRYFKSIPILYYILRDTFKENGHS